MGKVTSNLLKGLSFLAIKYGSTLLDELFVIGIDIIKEKFSNSSSKKDELKVIGEYLEALVSIWAHASKVDGKIQVEEVKLIEKFSDTIAEDLIKKDVREKEILKVNVTFDKIKANEIKKRIKSIFDNPLPFTSIRDYAIDNGLEVVFYKQAILILAADGKLTKQEKVFIDSLSKELNISSIDKTLIDSKLLENIKGGKGSLLSIFH
jgi:hypothetical protein